MEVCNIRYSTYFFLQITAFIKVYVALSGAQKQRLRVRMLWFDEKVIGTYVSWYFHFRSLQKRCNSGLIGQRHFPQTPRICKEICEYETTEVCADFPEVKCEKDCICEPTVECTPIEHIGCSFVKEKINTKQKKPVEKTWEQIVWKDNWWCKKCEGEEFPSTNCHSPPRLSTDGTYYWWVQVITEIPKNPGEEATRIFVPATILLLYPNSSMTIMPQHLLLKPTPPAQNPHMSQHLNQNHTNLALNLWYITQPQNRIVLTPNQHMFQSTSQKPKENPTFLAPEPNPNPGDGTRFQLLLNKPIFS